MLTKLVLPGDKIEIQTIERSILGKSSDKKAYQSRVFDILSDEEMEILMPMEGTKLTLLPVDGEYDICFYTRNGLYQCYVRIKDRYKSQNNFILLCEVTTKLRKYQRREYYRYACILDMFSRPLTEDENTAVENGQVYFEDEQPTQKSRIVDISGGGVRFTADFQYEPGTLIYLTYTLPIGGREKNYDIIGQVLASKAVENRQNEYEHRLKYLNMEKEHREEIIRYIFEEERKNRQRKNG